MGVESETPRRSMPVLPNPGDDDDVRVRRQLIDIIKALWSEKEALRLRVVELERWREEVESEV